MINAFQLVEHETTLRRFQGHVAVVTGAATGIGRACALRFAQEGANVACLDVNVTGNDATAEACRRYGTGVISLRCDVSSEHDVQRAIAQVISLWERIDTLVAAAGIYAGGLLSEVQREFRLSW